METFKDLARALRRHHAKRLKKGRASYWGRNYPGYSGEAMDGRQLGMVLATPASCSCWMCGNPRRKQGERTMQEQRFRQVGLRELVAQAQVERLEHTVTK